VPPQSVRTVRRAFWPEAAAEGAAEGDARAEAAADGAACDGAAVDGWGDGEAVPEQAATRMPATTIAADVRDAMDLLNLVSSMWVGASDRDISRLERPQRDDTRSVNALLHIGVLECSNASWEAVGPQHGREWRVARS